MFDVEVGGQVYRESEAEEPGEETNLCDAEGWRVGLTVCYDLRFPELYRILALQGAELVTVPAAFTLYTGKDHWELLLRARAVENQCYVLAANEWGVHEGGKQSYGRSSIVDPWGVVLAQAPDEDCVIAAEIDKARLEQVRHDLPSLANRQPAAYRWPAGGLGVARPLRAVLFDVDFTLTKPGPLLGPEGYRRPGSATGSRSTPPSTARRERLPSWTSSTIRSSTMTRRSGCASPRTSCGAWEARATRSERSPRRSPRAGSTRRTSSCTRTRCPALAELRKHGLRIGLVSNTGRDLDHFIRHFALDVDAWISSGTHGKVKPSPTIFRVVLEMLEVEAAEAVMVGDSIADDVEGAEALGMRAFLVDRDGRYADRDDALPTLLDLPAALGLCGLEPRPSATRRSPRRRAAPSPGAVDLDPRAGRVRARLLDHDRRRVPAARARRSSRTRAR